MKKLMYFVSFAVMTLMTAACSNDEVDNVAPQVKERVPHYATLEFSGDKPSFGDEGTTRAAADSWTDGSKVYLQFTVGSTRVDGVATYNSSAQEWTIEYFGALTATNDGKCEAYYFENAGDATYRMVSLTNASAIFVDKSASYSFEDNTVKVTANLKPMTGRIRFKGSASQDFFLDGITSYCTYNIEENKFETTSPSIFATTGKDGYSDYIYGLFGDNEQREFIFNDIENNVSFIRTMGTNALAVAKSGYLDIPTIDNRSGWSTIRYKDYTVGKVDFRMIRVIGNRTQNSFYIGETEVTQGLWSAVMNTTLTGGDNLPVVNVSYNDCMTFIEKLNAKTGKTFRLPTYEEWKFAFIGGNLSKGYSYSGSSNYGDVAWYNDNSNNQRHEVKSRQANELGIYDMSGNVWEYMAWEGAGKSYYFHGGGYNDGYGNLRVNSNSWWNSGTGKSDQVGLRLIID